MSLMNHSMAATKSWRKKRLNIILPDMREYVRNKCLIALMDLSCQGIFLINYK